MDHLLLAVQNSHFAYWLAQGAFPPIITVHSAGMALLVGLQGMINLRVLGVGRAHLPMAAMRRFMKVVWIGFWMNLCSGVLLFSIYPDKYVHNTLFLFKISFIVSGLLLGAVLNATYVSVGDEYAAAGSAAPMRAKALAALSMCCWISAIVAGRYLAYSTFADIGAGGGS